MGRFVSADILRELAKEGKVIYLEKNAILTPSAKDLIKELGLTINNGDQVDSAKVGSSASAPCAVHVQEGSDKDLKKKIQKIVEETLKPACANPKALHVRGDQVIIKPFEEAPPGQRVGLTDVVTNKEGNLCAGFMTFDHCRMPWFLNYDEADYIVEGDFVLEVAGQTFTAKAGDVVYIPKGSQVVFSSPTFCKIFYVTYPANWFELCD